MKHLITLLLLLVSYTGIAQIKYVHTAAKEYPELDSRSEVTIFTDKGKVPANAEDVGMIICNTDNDKRAYKKARKIAANHGANGLYVKEAKEKSTGEKWMNTLMWSNYTDKTVFVAVYVPITTAKK